ncbi:MAG: EAL domain-containing protein [Actinomycetota bacterium]|nr:EAL domain-containing protein [Actinomycetota bacterium]
MGAISEQVVEPLDGRVAVRDDLRSLCVETLLACPEERVYFKDLSGRRILASAGSLGGLAFGGPPSDVVGKTDAEVFRGGLADSANADDRHILETGETIVCPVRKVTLPERGDMWFQTTKMPLRDRAGRIIGTFGITKDLTAQLEAERALEHLAWHDPLTGLPNRKRILDRIAHLLERSRRGLSSDAIAFLDLDDFKEINDTLGHQAGDELLVAASRRLVEAARPGDTVGRLGGDEFVVLFDGDAPPSVFDALASRLLAAFRRPFDLPGSPRPVAVSASVGIAEVRGDDPGDALCDADLALYGAKAAGKRRAVVFSPTMHVAAQHRRQLHADLEQALGNDELFLLYQPVIDLHTRATCGVEALLRWRHPRRGVVLPDQFIGELESTGGICAVGAWVLRQACAQASRWAARGHRCTMAVNVSAEQLANRHFEEDVRVALDESGLDPSLLVLELTESVLVGDRGGAVARLARLRRLGVRIALDDFGTGYSSLSYLGTFPVDILKIDRSFVADVATSAESAAVAHALVELARALGLSTVAEGIERPDQLCWFRRERVEVGQGFLFSEPVEPAAIEALLDGGPLADARHAAG